ncbi:MAG: hypothetical protein AAF913_05000 [Pseudomonadota bacterium]
MTQTVHLPRAAFWLVFCLLATLAPAQADDGAGLCRYYSNMAFNDRMRAGETTFRMDLARDCGEALRHAQSADPQVRARAQQYLAALAAYRGAMVTLLVTRAEERSRDPGINRHVKPVVRPVSRTGAYLIARHIGLVRQRQDWVAWRRSAALTD